MEKKNLTKGLSFDPLRQRLNVNGVETKITTKESELLDFMSDRINEISYRDEVLNTIWNDTGYFNARSMDVYICKLRKLLKPLGDTVQIVNVHGKGHKLVISNG